MNYKELQAAVKIFKQQGLTTIKLNSKKEVLEAEYTRLTSGTAMKQEPIKVETMITGKTETREFEIRTAYLDTAKDVIKDLSKKAKRVGVKPPIITIGDERLVTEYYENWEGAFKFKVSYTKISITYQPINLPGGWQFAASIETIAKGCNLIKSNSDLSDKLPLDLRTKKLTCDHCNTNRARKKHFALVSDAGETKVVGSSCVNDFLGHNAIKALEYLTWENNFFGAISNEDDPMWDAPNCRQPLEADIKSVLNKTFASIRTHGWKKSGDLDSTHVEVERQLFSKKLEEDDHLIVTDEDVKNTETILAKWEGLSENADPYKLSDFDWKKVGLFRRGAIAPNLISTCVGAAFADWMQAKKDYELRQINAQSEFFGTIKKREQFKIHVTKVVPLESDWGCSNMVTGILEGTSNKFVWFDSQNKDWYEEQQSYEVKATVKDHKEDPKWGKQTVLTRVA